MPAIANRARQIADLGRSLRRARAVSGRPVLRQLAEIARLRRYPNRLYWEEYFDMRLFEKSPAEAGTFVGLRMERLFDALMHDMRWRAVIDDKLLFDDYMRPKGFPLAETYGAILPDCRGLGAAPTASDAAGAADLLRRELRFPCFVKAIAGSRGEAAEILTGYDPASDTMVRKFGAPLEVDAYMRDTLMTAAGGALFQELLETHPEMAVLGGEALCTFRVVVLMRRTGPQLIRAFWKVIQGENITNHFKQGSRGNLLASLDPADGRITTLARGVGFDADHVEANPETGARLLSECIPRWAEVADLTLSAAREFPMIGMQFWDIALAKQGPVLIEINDRGAIPGAQGEYLDGLYDADFISFLAERGHDFTTRRTQRLAERLATVDRALDHIAMDRAGIKDIYDTMGGAR